MLDTNEAEAVLTIALMAALADGRSGEAERDQLKSLIDTLAKDTEMPSLSQIHQRVVLKKANLSEEAAKLTTPESRQTAFEIAVCVADADGVTTALEQSFLDTLERALAVDHEQAVAFERAAESIAASGDRVDDRINPSELLAMPSDPAPVERSGTAGTAVADPTETAVDKLILKYAILNGALELLPQNLATMAILPLQTRMVYAIGKEHGHSLGAGHIKEFIATLGIGATSQMLENVVRKAIGKFAKKVVGKTAAKMMKAATGPMMTFATTYAMGQAAKAYYAGGRTLSAVDLRQIFERELARGKVAYDTHRPAIESGARSLSPTKVLEMVRGKA